MKLNKKKMCDGKFQYESEEKAYMAAEAMSIKFGKNLESYKCPFCKEWHIGRKI